MAKKKYRKMSKKEIFSLLGIFGVAILVILSPFLLTAVLATAFPSVDGYLLTGFSFCVFGFVALSSVLIVLYRTFVPKKNKLDYFKSVYKKYGKFVFYFILPMLGILIFLEGVVVYAGSTYLKDIVQGPREEIMKDAYVDVDSHRGGSTTYLVGYVDGEKVWLEVTGSAHSQVSRRESYKMLRIRYYEHIQEVYYVEVWAR